MTKALHLIALILTVLGALNWGLVGAFDFNLVTTLFGAYPMIVKLIYILVGLSALALLAVHFRDCKLTNHARHND